MISYGISHKGNVRSENQDAYINIDNSIGELNNIYVVADGMGGHLGGAMASKLAIDTIIDSIKNMSDVPLNIITAIILKANEVVYNTSVEDSSLFGMGTTVEVITINNSIASFVHVGDSRIYAVSDNEITQLSHDHSYVQELLDNGAITKEEAYSHPNKNRITKALGVDKTLNADCFEFPLNLDWNYFMLCSDGLTNMIKDEQIHIIIKNSKNIKESCESLVQVALDNGGTDNITVVLVKLEGGLNND